jgi:hypothetical protein
MAVPEAGFVEAARLLGVQLFVRRRTEFVAAEFRCRSPKIKSVPLGVLWARWFDERQALCYIEIATPKMFRRDAFRVFCQPFADLNSPQEAR